MRVLLVDPSGRGGIADYTDLVARALVEGGAEPELLASRALAPRAEPYRVHRLLPRPRWGKPDDAGLRFYARRALDFSSGWAALESTVRRRHPDVVHFQAGLNRRGDAALIRRLRRRAPVVWTAHDVLPFVRTDADRAWFAAIYRTVDAVVVHTEPAAREVHELAGREATVIEHPVAPDLTLLSRSEARKRLGLPADGRLHAAVGFIRVYKGYGLLADVWERLGEDAPWLLVLGELIEESERDAVTRLAATPRAIVREGFASSEDLQLAIAAADAVLLPYTEASDSGILHLARGIGTPVLASDAPQLAASVRATGTGTVVRRTVEDWCAAVTGPLPGAPPAAPPLVQAGRDHVELYGRVMKDRGRLRVLAYTDADTVGGAENALATLMRALPKHFDVTVAGVARGVVEHIAAHREGSSTLLLPPVRDKRDVRSILAHVRAVRAVRPDVFHANLRHPWSCQYGLLAAALTPGVRIVAVEHAVTEPAGRLQRTLRRLVSRRLDAHVAVGDKQARSVAKLLGVEPKSLRVIRNPVEDVDRRHTSRAGGPPVIGALARLSPEKGIDLLVRALRDVPDARAVVVGEGPERATLERLARELGVEARLELAGWDPQARDRLADFDVLALPSRSEGVPLALVEAMLAGVPVVAADVGSVHEVVLDGETGILVPADDPSALAAALRRVLDDAELRRHLTERGRALALELFAPASAASAFERLYEEIRR